ncbi:uncharacterized protein [Ambystoma mexicanum]|uniref:uncharacterized protein isoform X2 n=1 Tax=Ambystoma mexicanum TaxID=8296 RepID=UPI0037E71F22
MAWPLGHVAIQKNLHESQRLHPDRFPNPIPFKELVKMKPGEDPDDFLRTFECVAADNLWPKKEWTMHLAPLLSADGQAIYQALPDYTANDYDQLKDALIKHMNVSEESCRKKFRSLPFLSEAGPQVVAQHLRELGRQWLKPEIRSSDEIVELIIVEQFIHILPADANEWLSHHQVQSLDRAVKLIECILSGKDCKPSARDDISDLQTVTTEEEQMTEEYPSVIPLNIKTEEEADLKCVSERRNSDCSLALSGIPLKIKCEEDSSFQEDPDISENIKDEDEDGEFDDMLDPEEEDLEIVPVLIKDEDGIMELDYPGPATREPAPSPAGGDGPPLTTEPASPSQVDPAPNPSRKRHAVADESQLDSLEIERNELRTRLQTKWAVDLFKGWLKESKRDVAFENLSGENLCQLLRTFYAEVRNSKGEEYHIQSLVCVRAGINRYLNSPPFSRGINIMHDTTFTAANNVFLGIIKRIRREAKGIRERHGAITREDLFKLRSSPLFATTQPTTLLNKVWFEVQLHLARRGREGLRILPPDAFSILSDEDGNEYASFTFNEAAKNNKDFPERGRSAHNGRMYAQPGSPSCPVAALKLYMSKMPAGAPCFYLQPRKLTAHQAANEKVWYTVRPLGKNALGNYMKTLSVKACLSKMYTNHCIRSTTVQLLSDAGLETREIMAVTGHRCPSSVKNYWKANEKQRSNWSGILSSAGVQVTTIAITPWRIDVVNPAQ